MQKHDPILDFTQVTPSARIATLTHGWRAKCLQRLVRLDMPVPETVALPSGTVRAIAQGASQVWVLLTDEEANALIRATEGDPDALDRLLARRTRGEPLAWLTGEVEFCGLSLSVDPGVYVPRPQTEALARRAAA